MRARVLVLALAVAVTAGLCAQDSFPAHPPAPAPLAPVRFPPFEQALLPNGVRLIVVAHHEQPVASVTIAFRAGALYDPAGKEGLSGLTADLLTKGAGTRTAEQLSSTVEGVGGSLGAAADEDFLTVSADVLSDQLPLAFELVGDVVRRPTFPAPEVELTRTRALSALQLALSDPGEVAGRFFSKELYGRHPYGRSPTADSYHAITRADVARFAATRLKPAGALLVVAGDVTMAQAKALALKTFAGWTGAAPAVVTPPAVSTKRSTDILLVHRAGSVQANIVAGNLTFGPADSGYYAARIASQILGGGADSRLFLILREQHGWTYGSYSALRRHRGVGYFQATAETRTAVADSALKELLHQLDRMRTEPAPDSELVGAKGFLVGSFPLVIETPSQIASQLANASLLGLPADYLQRYRERLNAVTAAQARAAAQRVIKRQALTIVVVGDAEALYDKLSAIAPVRLVDVDGKPLTLSDLHPTAGVPVLDHAQLVTRADSFQALAQGRPVGYETTTTLISGDSIVFRAVLDLGGGALHRQSTIHFAPADWSVTQADVSGTTQGQASETHLTYGGGRVKGRIVSPQPTGTPTTVDVDTTLAAGTYDEGALHVIVPALALGPNKTVNLNVFSGDAGRAGLMQFKVAGIDTVTVPAGKFVAYRVEVSGGQGTVLMHVTRDTPRRIVRIEFVGTPISFELVK
ncbi:MAG TPA: insulinase family protein [Gemmatimonadales bacterium]|nr:insulinase family protein [Gemmatimonadales bacterium]